MASALINGARLWYEERGSGPPVLLHHGYTASRVNWAPVAERLAVDHRVILMECRGTGESEHTDAGYDIGQYAADVLGLLDHLELDRVTFAGHSMGGAVGYLLGLDHAERLDNLVLMAPIPADGIGEIQPEIRAQRLAERAAGDAEAILARYRALRFREDVEPDAWFEDRVRHLLSVSDGHFIGSAESMEAFDVSARLAALSVPTLMLAGGVDNLLKANLRDYLALPNAVLEVIARAGHEVAVHEPDRVADVIRAFLRHGVVTAETLLARLENG